MNKSQIVLVVAVVVFFIAGIYLATKDSTSDLPQTSQNYTLEPTEAVSNEDRPTERYSAQVDRVKVLFEQWEYTRYRLQTNELVREGAMNSERGFGDDPDATVYVLNWDKPEGEQIRYVRLTAEPGLIYALDGYQDIIKSGPLVLEE